MAFSCEINFSIFSAIIRLLNPELLYPTLGVLRLPTTGASPQMALIHTPVNTSSHSPASANHHRKGQ
jgi:hypothetical protein